MPRQQRRNMTPEQEIAMMMTEDYGSNLGQNPNAGPIYMPSDDTVTTRVVDTVGGERHTEMRECSAVDCANNLRGESCGLAAIQIGERGGCANFETRGESRYEDDDMDNDDDTIIGISALMPAEVDLPTGRRSLMGGFGSFNNGTPF